MIRFLTSYLIFSVIIAAPIVLLQQTGLGAWLDPGFWKFFVFFFILTVVVSVTVIIGQQRDPMLGTQLFLGTMVIKLLLSMVFSLIYISKNSPDALHFVFSFFYLYFLNTAFEIFSLISNLRHQNKK